MQNLQGKTGAVWPFTGGFPDHSLAACLVSYTSTMSDIKSPQTIKDLPISIIRNVVVLSTSGFGVVVALAWNELIKKVVEQYVDPFLGKGGGVISLLIYAVVVTILAVVVTMQLASLERTVNGVHHKLRSSDKSTQKSK